MLPLCLVILCSLFIRCANIEDFNNAGESFYMPDIDIFVIRGPESGSVTGVERFVTPIGVDTVDYVIQVFTGEIGDYDNINNWLYTLGFGFYHSRIRVFFIRKDSSFPDPDDFLPDLTSSTSFTLTDDTGLVDKGVVNNESGPMKLFLAGDTSPVADYAGIAWVRGRGVLILSGSNGYSSRSFCYVLAHEIGHNLSLMHPFDVCSGIDKSCECAPRGSTNRVMDYTSGATLFIPCERLQAGLFCKLGFGYRKRLHDSDWGPTFEIYRGDWPGTVTVGKSGPAPFIPADTRIEADRWDFR